MLNKLTKQQIVNLRSSWAGAELYKAIRTCTIDFCKASNYYGISAEQLFVEVIMLVDEMKSGNPDWGTLYERIRQDYHLQDNLIEPDELHLIVSCILSIVFYISQSSEQIRFNRMGEELMNQVFRNSSQYKVEIYQLLNNLDDQEGLSNWIEQYLLSDEKWSERLTEYVKIQEETPVIHQTDTNIISKVMVDKKTLTNGVIIYPQTLLKKAAEIIDITSPTQVAILMETALRNEIIRKTTTPTQFLKALIELRIVNVIDDKTVRSRSTQIGNKIKLLPQNHLLWKTADQKLYQDIEKAFKGK